MKKSMILIALLALTLACNKQNGTASTASTGSNGNPAGSSIASTPATLTPEQLGELGAKIKAHPKDAQKILADAGLTESAFETQIRKVSSDPAASKRYAAAYKKTAA